MERGVNTTDYCTEDSASLVTVIRETKLGRDEKVWKHNLTAYTPSAISLLPLILLSDELNGGVLFRFIFIVEQTYWHERML